MASLGLGKTMEGVRKLATIECSSDVPFPQKNSETMGLKSFVQNLPSWKMFTHRHTHDIDGSSVHFFSALNNWLTGLVRFKTLSWLNSRSENDLCSCEATWAVAKEKKIEVSTGFEPMTSVIPVQCSTNWAMKPCWKQVKSEFNFPLLYEESEMMCIWYKSYIWTVDNNRSKSDQHSCKTAKWSWHIKGAVSPIIPSVPKCSSRHFIFHRKYECFE